jgi:hypothetical protein
MRRAAKRDLSESAIVDALRKLGWSVEFLSIAYGPDLLIGRSGSTHLIECKTGKGKLKAGQATWHREWRGAPVHVLRTPYEVVEFTTALEMAKT